MNDQTRFWDIQRLAKNPQQMATKILEMEDVLVNGPASPTRRKALLGRLKALKTYDPAPAALKAEELLLEFINDDEITDTYREIVG